jgi:hypothetical protein
MKRLSPSVPGSRFQAQIRHYHRSNLVKKASWSRWVDGDDGIPVGYWLPLVRMTLIVSVVLVALGALIVGFVNIA